jgi:hypothetical protein
MWAADLALATVPLWHAAHPELTETLIWNLAGNQFGYPALWQVLHSAPVTTWFVVLPVAAVPL